MTSLRAPRLPVGTQVVLREDVADVAGRVWAAGGTGQVAVDHPDGRYTVRSADGREALVRREQVALCRAYQHDVALAGAAVEDPAALVRDHAQPALHDLVVRLRTASSSA